MNFASYKDLAHATEEINSVSFADNYYLKLIVPVDKMNLKEWHDIVKFLKGVNRGLLGRTDDNKTNFPNGYKLETYVDGLLPTECEAPLVDLITKLIEVYPDTRQYLHFEWTSSKVDYNEEYFQNELYRMADRIDNAHYLKSSDLKLGMVVNVHDLDKISDKRVFLYDTKHVIDEFGLLDIQGTIVYICDRNVLFPPQDAIPKDYYDKPNYMYIDSYSRNRMV